MADYIWNYGIDWDADSTGATPLSGYYFVDPTNGSDTAVSGTPSLPYATLAYAYSQIGGNNMVLAKGAYDISNAGLSNFTYCVGNQVDNVIFYETVSGTSMPSSSSFENITFYGLTNFLAAYRNIGVDSCIFYDCAINLTFNSRFRTLTNSVLINTTSTNVTTTGDLQKSYTNNIHINSPLGLYHTGTSYNLFIDSCSFDVNSLLTVEWNRSSSDPSYDEQVTVSNCNLSGGTSYTDETAYEENNGIEYFSFNMLGDSDNLEYIVENDSSSFGGINGLSAYLKTGFLFNQNTDEYAINPTSNSGVTFGASGELGITNASDTIETARVSFGQIRTAPTFTVNGLQDTLIADNDDTMNIPNPNIFELQYTTTEGGSFDGTWVKFQYDLPLVTDANGYGTGNDNYDVTTPQDNVEIFDFIAKFTYL